MTKVNDNHMNMVKVMVIEVVIWERTKRFSK